VVLLLDTNVILFGLMAATKIPAHVRRQIETASNQCLVSVVSLYEIGRKSALGKLPLPEGFDLVRYLQRADIAILEIKPQHAVTAARLPLEHGDPWDRIIVAQCLVEGHQLISADTTISALGIGRIW
jgi:PIN domain nuclease of toxin-antitoxin system